MNLSSKFEFPASRCIVILALTLVAGVMAFIGYHRFVVTPEQEHVIRRYDQFRAVVASGDAKRIMEFVAPEFQSGAKSRLHLYQNFAKPLDNGSTVSVSRQMATVCPRPQRHYFVIPGGHTIGMVQLDGEWFMGRVSID